jgi:uncharacterized protein YwqG
MFREKDQVQNTPKYQDKESLAQALITAGISSDAARHLADLGRISLQLLPIDQQTKTKQPFSKIGGLPDLPEGMKWPIRPSLPPADYPSGIVAKLLNWLLYSKPSEEELNYRQNPQPYSFIAQISFEEMALLDDQSLLLPDGGALYLFYDVLIQGWGFDPKDALGFKVIYVPDTDNLKKATKPNFYKEVPDYKEVLLEPSLRFERSRSEGLISKNYQYRKLTRRLTSILMNASKSKWILVGQKCLLTKSGDGQTTFKAQWKKNVRWSPLGSTVEVLRVILRPKPRELLTLQMNGYSYSK